MVFRPVGSNVKGKTGTWIYKIIAGDLLQAAVAPQAQCNLFHHQDAMCKMLTIESTLLNSLSIRQLTRINSSADLQTLETRMMSRIFAFLAIVACVSAFAPARGALRTRSAVSMSVFDKAVKDWAAEYPAIYNVGWGPTTKAERWNGRHAMFGWVALLVTGYCKGHGLIPNPETALDLKEWGTLAYLYGGSISNERAIIIVGEIFIQQIFATSSIFRLNVARSH